MPIFTLQTKNRILDDLSPNVLSLHTAYDPSGASFEVAGGTPAYARMSVVFAAANSGTKSLTLGPYNFDVPATTVSWVGVWNLSLFLCIVPNGGDAIRPFVVDDLAAGTLKSALHNFLINDTLVIWRNSADVILPSPLVEGNTYYVVDVDANSVLLSATLGGPPIALTNTGNGFIQRIVPVSYASQGTFAVNAMTLDATVAA